MQRRNDVREFTDDPIKLVKYRDQHDNSCWATVYRRAHFGGKVEWFLFAFRHFKWTPSCSDQVLSQPGPRATLASAMADLTAFDDRATWELNLHRTLERTFPTAPASIGGAVVDSGEDPDWLCPKSGPGRPATARAPIDWPGAPADSPAKPARPLGLTAANQRHQIFAGLGAGLESAAAIVTRMGRDGGRVLLWYAGDKGLAWAHLAPYPAPVARPHQPRLLRLAVGVSPLLAGRYRELPKSTLHWELTGTAEELMEHARTIGRELARRSGLTVRPSGLEAVIGAEELARDNTWLPGARQVAASWRTGGINPGRRAARARATAGG